MHLLQLSSGPTRTSTRQQPVEAAAGPRRGSSPGWASSKCTDAIWAAGQGRFVLFLSGSGGIAWLQRSPAAPTRSARFLVFWQPPQALHVERAAVLGAPDAREAMRTVLQQSTGRQPCHDQLRAHAQGVLPATHVPRPIDRGTHYAWLCVDEWSPLLPAPAWQGAGKARPWGRVVSQPRGRSTILDATCQASSSDLLSPAAARPSNSQASLSRSRALALSSSLLPVPILSTEPSAPAPASRRPSAPPPPFWAHRCDCIGRVGTGASCSSESPASPRPGAPYGRERTVC
jgi:hypothetical protein